MKQGWEIKKLGEVCETSSGGTPSKTHKEYYEGGNIPWLRSGEVSQGLIYDTELYITEEGLKNSSAKIFPIDTVVIAMYGATVGQVGILKRAMPTNQAVCGIFPTTTFEPLFLVYYLKAKKPYYLSMAAGGAQPNISQQIIRDTYIPIPSREEQERIVAELDCLSGVIEKKREQLKELDALAQSIFYQMFGDPIINEKGWDVKKFEDCYKLASGNGLSAKQIIDGDYPVYGGNGIVGYHHEYNLDGNNIIIGRVGALCGNVRNIEGKAFITDNAFILTKKIDNDNVFLLHLLRIHNLRKYAREAMQPVISNAGLKNIDIIITPIALQYEFADKIEAIEKQKELIKKSITQTEELFNSRMDYYFN